MVEEYKVRSGFKCNPWAIKKLSGLQLSAFICPCFADPSAATILASHCRLLIQMYSPCLSLPGVGAPSDTVVHVYSLVFYELKQVIVPTQSSWFACCSRYPHIQKCLGEVDVKARALNNCSKKPFLRLDLKPIIPSPFLTILAAWLYGLLSTTLTQAKISIE